MAFGDGGTADWVEVVAEDLALLTPAVVSEWQPLMVKVCLVWNFTTSLSTYHYYM